MKTLIQTVKTGAGHYEVTISNNEKEVNFTTTDMQIIDDLHEYRNDGFESELIHFDSFAEIEKWANDKINA